MSYDPRRDEIISLYHSGLSPKDIAEKIGGSTAGVQFALVRFGVKLRSRRDALAAARALMTETELKLDSIADECGFTSTSDFCRAFKAHTKVTPTVWRQTILAPPRAARE